MIVQIAQAAASGPEVARISGRGKHAQEADREERQLEAGVEQLVRDRGAGSRAPPRPAG